jgi:hypothetical protein
MTLINVEASRPSPLWALVRLLAFHGRPVRVEQAEALLSPACLSPNETKMFDQAVERSPCWACSPRPTGD